MPRYKETVSTIRLSGLWLNKQTPSGISFLCVSVQTSSFFSIFSKEVKMEIKFELHTAAEQHQSMVFLRSVKWTSKVPCLCSASALPQTCVKTTIVPLCEAHWGLTKPPKRNCQLSHLWLINFTPDNFIGWRYPTWRILLDSQWQWLLLQYNYLSIVTP
jgi:hypothetical protein